MTSICYEVAFRVYRYNDGDGGRFIEMSQWFESRPKAKRFARWVYGCAWQRSKHRGGRWLMKHYDIHGFIHTFYGICGYCGPTVHRDIVARLAQLVEQHPDMVEVPSSSLGMGI